MTALCKYLTEKCGLQGNLSRGHESQAASRRVHALPHCHLHPWGGMWQCHFHVSSKPYALNHDVIERVGQSTISSLAVVLWLHMHISALPHDD